MRLLDVNSLRLKLFTEAQTPRYAILSHVWGREEVTFADIHDLAKAHRMRGFDKIELSCIQARRDGLDYIWIDTCCIDKSSSSELSEAINTMFRWYQQAAVCYAYLCTTSTLSVPRVGADTYDDAVLENSPWFRRGWTLQELIAPKRVEFHGARWLYLGNKHALCERLSRITRIPQLLLRDSRALLSYSIAQRMSWAAGRSTTRIEDKAYSLLGIVGVNMPLLYGEGGNAFIRLQEEIIKISTDDSILAWSGRYSRDDLRLSMLAPDPAAFGPAANVVPLSGHGSSSYAITNRGLEIRLPLL
ncbi:heterokaryon incompatibility protein-domain-containing protein, partial [Immersiella caudata]